MYSNKLLSLKQLCDQLSVSVATGRNWIRLGKIVPEYTEGKKHYFSESYVSALRDELRSGRNPALKSRRNKKYVSGNAFYGSYVSENCKNLPVIQKLLALIEERRINLNKTNTGLLVADCALHLFADKKKINFDNNPNLLLRFLEGGFSTGGHDELITALIKNKTRAKKFCTDNLQLFNFSYIYEPNEDVLGLLYISLKNIGSRKATGSYYTPTKTVKRLINITDIKEKGRILDPCCGTGNFLLQLPQYVEFDYVFGNDLDNMSVGITRLNMALKYDAEPSEICEHITRRDFLKEYSAGGFGHIIGNPPWGYDFSGDEIKRMSARFRSASKKKPESYDIFIEKSLRHLSDNARMTFVLPEALLNVKAHKEIRKIILENCSLKNIDFIGNVFDGVQCPCIILDLEYTRSPLSTLGMKVTTAAGSFTVNTDRNISSECFDLTMNDREYDLIQKLKNHKDLRSLSGNADFALGIVTGNNKGYISKKKNDENEPVLKGSDICRYYVKPAENYIVFKPERFQQVAPVGMYRAKEKLMYRFISRQLVFAYDDRQTLSLNSCNIVIPKISGLKMKYVLAVLNSRVAQFIYKLEYNSVKVLRTHIESIPIPYVNEDVQDRIIALVDRLISWPDANEAERVYDELDFLIDELFELTPEEIQLVNNTVDPVYKRII